MLADVVLALVLSKVQSEPREPFSSIQLRLKTFKFVWFVNFIIESEAIPAS